jgi:hypothetical protein
MGEPPTVAFLLEAMHALEHLERKLAELPENAESTKAEIQASIRELRKIIRMHAA